MSRSLGYELDLLLSIACSRHRRRSGIRIADVAEKKTAGGLGEVHRRDPRWGARGSRRPACAGGTQALGRRRNWLELPRATSLFARPVPRGVTTRSPADAREHRGRTGSAPHRALRTVPSGTFKDFELFPLAPDCILRKDMEAVAKLCTRPLRRLRRRRTDSPSRTCVTEVAQLVAATPPRKKRARLVHWVTRVSLVIGLGALVAHRVDRRPGTIFDHLHQIGGVHRARRDRDLVGAVRRDRRLLHGPRPRPTDVAPHDRRAVRRPRRELGDSGGNLGEALKVGLLVAQLLAAPDRRRRHVRATRRARDLVRGDRDRQRRDRLPVRRPPPREDRALHRRGVVSASRLPRSSSSFAAAC